jgi:hypothetical protein
MDTLLCNDDGTIINFTVPSATDEILAFHYGNFDDAYGDGTVGAAAANGRVYGNTVPATLPAKFGSIGTPSTASGQTTYTWTPPSTSMNANVLVVAGGGGGGGRSGGGGGAGGLIYQPNQTLNSASYTIVVGQGGAGGAGTGTFGTNGKNSTGFGVTVIGGGGGASDPGVGTGLAGGSGGGGRYGGGGGTGTTGQGNNGGGSTGSGSYNGGGGGGAGSIGETGTTTKIGDGGAGFLASVYGENYGESGWFAGGGGGGSHDPWPGSASLGGIGGGGVGGTNAGGGTPGEDGDAHTGGGGGAGSTDSSSGGAGGNGGSGIVLVRYIADNTIISHEEIGAFDILGSSVSSASLGTYSLRRIFGSYTGAQVKIRRSTDNVETDIYFDKYGNMIDFNLTTWLNGATAYVTTWYDQSGNGNDITQTDTASQPILTAPSGERAYIRFQSKIMTGPNVFGTSTITNMHAIFASRENVRSNNYFVSLNGTNTGNPGRFFIHAPYGSGTWYWDPGSVSTDRAYGATSTLGAKTVFSGYKSTTNGFRLNGGTRYLSSGSTTATVTGGVQLGGGATDHSIYDLFIFTSKLSDSNERYIEWNAT